MKCTLIVSTRGADYNLSYDGIANVQLFHPRQNGYWAAEVDVVIMDISPSEDLTNFDLVVCREILDVTLDAMKRIKNDVRAKTYIPHINYLEGSM